VKDFHSEKEPHDRLTRMADAMTDALEAHPEYREGDRAIVMVTDKERCGGHTSGYDDNEESARDMVVDLLAHSEAIFASVGMDFRVIPMPKNKMGGQG
jgi:hypothetical protein